MQRLFMLLLFLGSSTALHACDICGCSNGNFYLGILPRFEKHFTGIRYQVRTFRSNHLPDLFGKPGAVASEKSHQFEIWGRVNPHKRVQIFYSMPIVLKERYEDGTKIQSTGPGDLTLMSSYTFVNTGDSLNRKYRHTFLAGGGIKLPTGLNNIQQNGVRLNQSLQPGSGSTDFMVYMMYTFRIRKWGLNNELNYRINTVNRYGYRFGNRLNISSRAFYLIQVGKTAFLPSAGLYLEQSVSDVKSGVRQSLSGGWLVAGQVGLDFYFGRIGIQTGARLPVAQHLSGGYVQNGYQVNAGIIVLY